MATATTRGTRLAIRRLFRAINRELGYPRWESEATGFLRVGGGRHVEWSKIGTRRHCRVLRRLTNYALVLDPIVLALDGRTVTITVDGVEHTTTIDLSSRTQILVEEWTPEDTDADDAL